MNWANKKSIGTAASIVGMLMVCSVIIGFSHFQAFAQSVTVNSASGLAQAITAANSGGANEIILEDGDYALDDMLWLSADNISVRSLSGNRESVVIRGKGMYGNVSHIFNVAGSNFSLRDVTLRDVANHAIQISGNLNAHAPHIKNVHILDTFEQMLKVSYNSDNTAARSDNGIVEDCLFEYSAGIGPQWYIGGIDVHNARNWIVRNNTFRGIRSPGGSIAEHAIHFWSDSRETLVEKNTIIDCDRGIGFGLGDRGHVNGIIRNNMIFHRNTSGDFADVGIALESAPGAQVYNNTIIQEHSYLNAIEYRFSSTSNVLIANNLTNRLIRQRDGASANVTHNIENADSDWFANPANGDLHLTSAVSAVIAQGTSITGLIDDFDGQSRPAGSNPDIGADQYGAAEPTVSAEIERLWPVQVSDGNTAVLWAFVKNSGSATFPNDTKVWFWVSGPGWSGDHWIGAAEAGGLEPDNSTWYQYLWTLPDNMQAGTYTYICQVWSGGQAVSSWSESQDFDIGGSPPAKTTLVSPSGAIEEQTPTFVWNAVEDSTWYYLWVDDSFGEAVVQKWYKASDVVVNSICSTPSPVDLPEGTYKWWVKTYNDYGHGPWSSALNFTVSGSSVPAQATLISPTGEISDTTPQFHGMRSRNQPGTICG